MTSTLLNIRGLSAGLCALGIWCSMSLVSAAEAGARRFLDERVYYPVSTNWIEAYGAHPSAGLGAWPKLITVTNRADWKRLLAEPSKVRAAVQREVERLLLLNPDEQTEGRLHCAGRMQLCAAIMCLLTSTGAQSAELRQAAQLLARIDKLIPQANQRDRVWNYWWLLEMQFQFLGSQASNLWGPLYELRGMANQQLMPEVVFLCDLLIARLNLIQFGNSASTREAWQKSTASAAAAKLPVWKTYCDLRLAELAAPVERRRLLSSVEKFAQEQGDDWLAMSVALARARGAQADADARSAIEKVLARSREFKHPGLLAEILEVRAGFHRAKHDRAAQTRDLLAAATAWSNSGRTNFAALVMGELAAEFTAALAAKEFANATAFLTGGLNFTNSGVRPYPLSQALKAAIKADDTAFLRAANRAGWNANDGLNYFDPLGSAVDAGQTNTISLLLKLGARPRRGGYSHPLNQAISGKRWDILDLLVNAGIVFPKGSNYSAEQAFVRAVKQSEWRRAALLLKGRLEIDWDGYSVKELFKSQADSDDEEGMRFLVKSGFKVDGKDYTMLNLYFAAIRNGDLKRVGLFLEAGMPANVVAGGAVDFSEYDGTALGQAALKEDLPMVDLLLKAGADTEFTGPRGHRTALYVSAAKGSLSIMRRLLGAKADVNFRDRGGETALWGAVLEKQTEAAKLLLAAGADPNLPDSDGGYVLARAARANQTALTKLLLAEGAKAAIKSDDGEPILIDLVRYRSDQDIDGAILRALVEHGADPFKPFKQGKTPLHFAFEAKNSAQFKAMLGDREAPDWLQSACRNLMSDRFRLRADTLQFCLQVGYDPNTRLEDGETHLMHAASRAEFATGKMLLEHGADANLLDEDGRSVLGHIGVWNGKKSLDLPRHLLTSVAGLRPPPADLREVWNSAIKLDDVALLRLIDSGQTTNNPVYGALTNRLAEAEGNVELAIKGGSNNVLKYFLEAGRKLSERGAQMLGGQLVAAIGDGDRTTVELLLRAGVYSGSDEDGSSPIHAAVRRGDQQLISRLLKLGANPSQRMKDGTGRNGLLLAVAAGDVETARLMLKQGASPNVRRLDGKRPTALHVAARFEQPEIVRLLLEFDANPSLRDDDGKTTLEYLKGLKVIPADTLAALSARSRAPELAVGRRLDHVDGIWLSPDNSLLAIHDETEGALRIHEARTGRFIRNLSANLYGLNEDVDFLDSGRILLTEQHEVRCVDLANGATLFDFGEEYWSREIKRMRGFVATAVLADGERAVSASGTDVMLWSLADRQILRKWRATDYQNEIKAIAVSQDGKRLAVASKFGQVGVWEIESGKRIARHGDSFRNMILSVNELAVSPDGEIVAFHSEENGMFFVYNLKSGKREHRFRGPEDPNVLAISPDSKWLVAGDYDQVLVFDLAEGGKATMKLMDFNVVGLSFLKGERVVAWDSRSERLLVLDLETKKELRRVATPNGKRVRWTQSNREGDRLFIGDGEAAWLGRLDGQEWQPWQKIECEHPVRYGAWDPETLCLFGYQGMVSTFSPTAPFSRRMTGGLPKFLVGIFSSQEREPYRDEVFHLDGSRFVVRASGFRDRFGIWDAELKKYVLRVDREPGMARVLSSDGTRLLVARKGGVDVLDAQTGAITRQIFTHEGGRTRAELKNYDISGMSDAERAAVNQLRAARREHPILTSPDGGWELDHSMLRSVDGAAELRLEHPANIESRVFTPDSQWLITGAEDTDIRIWNVADGELLNTLKEHAHAVRDLKVSADGRYLASAGNRVIVWDLRTRKPIWRSEILEGIVRLSFIGETRLLAEGWDGQIYSWEVPDGQSIGSFAGEDMRSAGGYLFYQHAGTIQRWQPGSERGESLPLSVANRDQWAPLNEGQSILVLSSSEGMLHLDLKGKALREPLLPKRGNIVEDVVFRRLLAFSPDGDLLAATRPDGGLDVRNAAGKPVFQLPGGLVEIMGLSFVAEDRLRLAYWDGRIETWNLETASREPDSIKREGGYSRIALSADGTSAFRSLNEMGRQHRFERLDLRRRDADAYRSPLAQVGGMQLSADGNTMVVMTEKALQFLDLNNGRVMRRFEDIQPYDSDALAISPDSSRLAIGRGNGMVEIRDARTGRRLEYFSAHLDPVDYLKFSRDGEGLYTASSSAGENSFKSWNLDRLGAPALHLPRRVSSGNSPVVALHEGKGLAVSDEYHPLQVGGDRPPEGSVLWRLPDGKVIRRLGAQQRRFAFSRDGQWLFAARTYSLSSEDDAPAVISAFDSGTGNLVRQYRGFVTSGLDGEVQRVAVSRGGRLLAAVNALEILVWEVATGTLKQRIDASQAFAKLAFVKDDRYLAVHADHERITFYDLQERGRKLVWMAFDDGSWVALDQDGRYDSNQPGDLPNLSWLLPDDPLKPLPVEVFMKEYFYPGLVGQFLAGVPMKKLAGIGDLIRVQPLVEIQSIEAVPDRPEQVLVQVSVAGNRRTFVRDGTPVEASTGVYDLQLFRDGQLVAYFPPDDGEVRIASEATNRTITLGPIPLSALRAGRACEFTALAFNVDGIKSETSAMTYTVPASHTAEDRRVYIVSMGVNQHQNSAWNLKYAAADARAVSQTLTELIGRNTSAQDITTLRLISDGSKTAGEAAARKDHLRVVLEALAGKAMPEAMRQQIPHADRIRKTRPHDVVIITFSGHGVMHESGEFYLLPADLGPGNGREFDENARRRSISASQLASWIRDVDAEQLVLVVDACNSAGSVGRGFRPGPMGSRGFGQLAYNKGMRILAASGAEDYALEDEQIRHGFLTYSLVQDGLRLARADWRPRDRRIEVGEWLAYGVRRVPELMSPGKKASRSASLYKGVSLLNEAPEELQTIQQPVLFDFFRGAKDDVLQQDE